MPGLRDNIEENKRSILDNHLDIRHNQKEINENKSAIHQLKTNCSTNCVPHAVFDSAVAKYDKIVHKLIVALCIVIILLFVSNAVWLFVWNAGNVGRKETTVITKDGVSNFVGNDGFVRDDDK